MDLWHWRVTYRDGSTLNEVDADGRDHGWAEVDVKNVVLVELVPQRRDLPLHQMQIDGAWMPSFFRRRSIGLSLSTGEEVGRSTVHVLGIGTLYLFLFADGRLLLTDNFQAV